MLSTTPDPLRESCDPRSGSRAPLTNQRWKPSQCAVIVCDLWDKHWCCSATERTLAFLPVTNMFLADLRSQGATIIHCPSDTMAYYKDHPCRRRMLSSIKNQPVPIIHRDPIPPLPISLGNTDGCDDTPPCISRNVWTCENEIIQIDDDLDYIGDDVEPLQLLEQLGITKVVLTGVHLNLCCLNRNFGCRALVSQGISTIVVSDLTDVMYLPSANNNMDRAQAIASMAAFINEYVCPARSHDDIF